MEGDTRYRLASEIRAKRNEARGILRGLGSGEYGPAIPDVLFDYSIFQRVLDGEFDPYLGEGDIKADCQQYINMAESVREEMGRYTSQKNMLRKIGRGEQRAALAHGKRDTGEILKEMLGKLRQEDTARFIECDEGTMKTFTALAQVKARTLRDLLYAVYPEEQRRSRRAPFVPPDLNQA